MPEMRAASAMLVGFLDQGVSSVTNFLAVVLAAVLLDAEAFGYVAIAYTLYLLTLGLAQAYLSQTYVIVKQSDAGDRGVVLAQALSGGTLVSVAIGVTSLLPIPGGMRGPLLVVAAALPALMVQDVLRTMSAARGRPDRALMADLTWLAGFLAAIGTIIAFALPVSGVTVLGAWALGGALSAVVAVFLARRTLSLPPRHLLWKGRVMGGRFVLEHALTQGVNQIAIIAVGGIAGPSATGALRGATTLFGPGGVLISAVPVLLLPPLKRIQGRQRVVALTLLSALLAAVPLSILAGLLAISDEWGSALLGDTWAEAQPVLIPIGLQFAAIGIGTVAFTALRIKDPRGTLSVKVIGSLVFLTAFWGGYAVGGLELAAWGLFAGSTVQAILLWLRYLRPTRQLAA